MNPAVIHLAAWLCRRVKFTGRVSGGSAGGLLPVLPVFRRKRRLSPPGGADKRHYGKKCTIRVKSDQCGFF